MRERRVLQLNSDYLPVAVRTWQDTMCMVFKGAVRPVEYYEDFYVRSAHRSHQVPSVITTTSWIKFKPRVQYSKAAILKRDNYCCMYCGRKYPAEYKRLLTVDHVHPRSRGGRNSFENLVAACVPCNNKKADRTPAEADMPLIRKPKAPSPIEGVQYRIIKNHRIEPEWEPWLQPYLAHG